MQKFVAAKPNPNPTFWNNFTCFLPNSTWRCTIIDIVAAKLTQNFEIISHYNFIWKEDWVCFANFFIVHNIKHHYFNKIKFIKKKETFINKAHSSEIKHDPIDLNSKHAHTEKQQYANRKSEFANQQTSPTQHNPITPIKASILDRDRLKNTQINTIYKRVDLAGLRRHSINFNSSPPPAYN